MQGYKNVSVTKRNDQLSGNYHITLVPLRLNKMANEVALSVTRDHRVQSYVAHVGPAWLSSLIRSEASGNSTC
ncbi:hypothetical protein YC2023_033864 [Brassica napus]